MHLLPHYSSQSLSGTRCTQTAEKPTAGFKSIITPFWPLNHCRMSILQVTTVHNQLCTLVYMPIALEFDCRTKRSTKYPLCSLCVTLSNRSIRFRARPCRLTAAWMHGTQHHSIVAVNTCCIKEGCMFTQMSIDAAHMIWLPVVPASVKLTTAYLKSGATVRAVTCPCQFSSSPSTFPKMYPIAFWPAPSAIKQYSGQFARYCR